MGNSVVYLYHMHWLCLIFDIRLWYFLWWIFAVKYSQLIKCSPSKSSRLNFYIRVRILIYLILILLCKYLLMPKTPTEQSDEKSKELITACDAWIRKSIMEKLWKNKTNNFVHIMNPFQFIIPQLTLISKHTS